MRILWFVNVKLPELSSLVKENINPFGGWLVNTSLEISKLKNIELAIATFDYQSSTTNYYKGKNIDYWIFPWTRVGVDSKHKLSLNHLIKNAKPDIVHIFGTEYSHTKSVVQICKSEGIKCIISIQGLVSIYEKHYMAFLPCKMQYKISLRDLIRLDSLHHQRKKYIKRGEKEIDAIQDVKHVIGRTTWDKACVLQINPNVNYHFCNESLREEFYKYTWNIDECEKYSIFISQASYPIKGLHLLLEALPYVIKKFPKTKLFIAGDSLIPKKGQWYKSSTYSLYISKLIKEFNLENHVFFTGILNEKAMCQQYLKANVFVCPSSIENSPNSLGEAMLLGVPCIASDVGGVTDLITHRKEGFVYQADAPYMLAHYICEIFQDQDTALMFSKNARYRAQKTHNINKNRNQLVSIYESVITDDLKTNYEK